MKMTRIAVCLIVLSAAAANSPGATLTLDVPNLSGAALETVGWGFTFTSTPVLTDNGTITPWLVLSDVEFVLDLGVNPVGVFTPFAANSFMVVGPDTGNGEVNPWTQAFDNGAQTGVGSYAINGFQSPGDSATGSIVFTFDEFSRSPNDPAFDPTTDTLANGLQASASASVTVSSGADVPEPMTFVMCALGLMPAIWRRRHRARYHTKQYPCGQNIHVRE